MYASHGFLEQLVMETTLKTSKIGHFHKGSVSIYVFAFKKTLNSSKKSNVMLSSVIECNSENGLSQ